MKYDIILAGVGGQGVVSLSTIIAASAMRAGHHVKQSEVHGMAQRGGAVLANLRIADQPIHSTIIPRATADMILGMEPVESLRYLDYLSPGGWLVTSSDPVVNIADYPDQPRLLATIRSMPRAILVDADRLARASGSARCSNVVMVGAASGMLPIPADGIISYIREAFASKGPAVVEANLKAFAAGREAVPCPVA